MPPLRLGVLRDPSALFGPVAGVDHLAGSLAASLAGSLRGGDRWLNLWRNDVEYCHAAGLFDGRRAPNLPRLRGAAARAGSLMRSPTAPPAKLLRLPRAARALLALPGAQRRRGAALPPQAGGTRPL